MLPKSYVVFKWVVYAIATLLLCAMQSVALDHVRVLGLTPFLYPVLPALVAMFEGPRRGAVFGLAFGLACGLLAPEPFPGFFTVVFPAAAVVSAWVAERLLSRGFLCALIVASLALLLTGGGRMFVQILSGGQYLGSMARIVVGEGLLTLPALVVALPLYRAVYRRCAADY